MRLTATDLDVLQVVADFWGVSVVELKRRRENWSLDYQITVSGSKAVRWMETLYPYMGLRRKGQIIDALGYQPTDYPIEVDMVQWIAGLFGGRRLIYEGAAQSP